MLTEHEHYVVKCGRQYVVAIPYGDTKYCRFSASPYDGWKTKRFDAAIRMAKTIGGKVFKFNQLNGNTEGGWQ